MRLDDVSRPGVCRITPGARLCTVQQMRQGLAVMRVGCSECHRMHEFALASGADVRFHTEMPLIALLGLLHLRIARFYLVLGRGGGADDGGFVRNPLATQINTRKLAHRHRILQRPPNRRIREAEPVLQTVDSNHSLQIDRQPPAPPPPLWDTRAPTVCRAGSKTTRSIPEKNTLRRIAFA